MSTKPEFYTNEIAIPDGVSINKDQNLITANGSNGKVQKDFTKNPALIEIDKEKITIRFTEIGKAILHWSTQYIVILRI